MTKPATGEHDLWPDGDPGSACLILDFDGVLAPIVADPEQAEAPPETHALLERLVSRLGRVALVSGRPASFLADKVQVPGVDLVGLYGLEQVTDGAVVPDERVIPYLDDVEAAKAALADTVAAWPGSWLEDKGRAVAVHWRNAEDRDGAAAALQQTADGFADRLTAEPGKMVLELRPPVEADKGTAVARLAEGFAEVAYAGDDLGDLPAFAEVLRRGGFAVSVDHGPETDPRVRGAGSILVSGIAGMREWLQGVVLRVGA